MKSRSGVLLVVILSLPCVGNRFHPRDPASNPPEWSAESARLLADAKQHFVSGSYQVAQEVYRQGLSRTDPENILERTAFLLGIGNCLLVTSQYAPALERYNEAFRLASSAGLQQPMLMAAVNRASIYRSMVNSEAALEAMRQVSHILAGTRDPQGLLQAANVVRDIDFKKSVQLYRAAIAAAERLEDRTIEASIWNHLGHAYQVHDELERADHALTESFRLRVLNQGRQITSSYLYLGWLRRQQGDYESAINLLRRAMELAAQRGSPISIAIFHRELARAYSGAGRYSEALAEFESAVRTGREWRMQVLPSDSYRVSAEADLQEIFKDYVQAGMQEYFRTGDQKIARTMFEVAEDSRTALFEAAISGTRDLPPTYWETLANYRTALARSLSAKHSAAAARLSQLRVQLADLEAQYGIDTKHGGSSHQIFEIRRSGDALLGLQRKLKNTEALLSFHLGTRGSFVWALTQKSFEVHRLPPSDKLQRQVEAFRDLTLQGRRQAQTAGLELSRTLLHGLSETINAKSAWILSLDGALFELPFAALPVQTTSRAQYLIRLHSLRLTPGALVLPETGHGAAGYDFAAVADARYNAADPRWNSPPAVDGALELSRLPGTAREIEACARAWARDPRPELVEGAQVNRERVMRLLDSRPAVLHLAAHVLPHPQFRDQVMVALGLQPSGDADYLMPADIVARPRPTGLVTLSGCGSGSGVALPGLGLFGLTRAWLVSGAGAVAATYWPITDDRGELLAAMYRELSGDGEILPARVAEALRLAQLRMLDSEGWRSEPAYWAAFLVVGKN